MKNKHHKTDGVTPSVSSVFSNPLNSTNTPTSDLVYTSKDQITQKTKSNKKF